MLLLQCLLFSGGLEDNLEEKWDLVYSTTIIIIITFLMNKHLK